MRATAALTVTLVALASGGCVGGDGDGDGDGDEVPESTTTTAAAPVARTTEEEAPLEVGQCGLVPDLRIGDVLDPATVQTVACTEPHDVEVAAVFVYPLDASADFPGAEAVDGYATDECIDRFEDYVGAPYLESSLDVIVVAPGEDGWDDGDRRIACVLYDIDFGDLVGSVAGTGL